MDMYMERHLEEIKEHFQLIEHCALEVVSNFIASANGRKFRSISYRHMKISPITPGKPERVSVAFGLRYDRRTGGGDSLEHVIINVPDRRPYLIKDNPVVVDSAVLNSLLNKEKLPHYDSKPSVIIDAIIAKFFNRFSLSSFPVYDDSDADTWGAYRKDSTIFVDIESFVFTLVALFEEFYGDAVNANLTDSISVVDFKHHLDTNTLYGPYGKGKNKFSVSFWI